MGNRAVYQQKAFEHSSNVLRKIFLGAVVVEVIALIIAPVNLLLLVLLFNTTLIWVGAHIAHDSIKRRGQTPLPTASTSVD